MIPNEADMANGDSPSDALARPRPTISRDTLARRSTIDEHGFPVRHKPGAMAPHYFAATLDWHPGPAAMDSALEDLLARATIPGLPWMVGGRITPDGIGAQFVVATALDWMILETFEGWIPWLQVHVHATQSSAAEQARRSREVPQAGDFGLPSAYESTLRQAILHVDRGAARVRYLNGACGAVPHPFAQATLFAVRVPGNTPDTLDRVLYDYITSQWWFSEKNHFGAERTAILTICSYGTDALRRHDDAQSHTGSDGRSYG